MPNTSPLQSWLDRLSSSFWYEREEACKELGRLGHHSATELLIQRLEDTEWRVRQMACAALGCLSDHRAVEPLIGRLGDEESSVRRTACESLGRLDDPRSVEPLVCLLGTDASNAASMALASMGRGSTALLIQRLGDANGGMRRAACAVLEQLGEQRLANAVMGALAGNGAAFDELARLAAEGDHRAVTPMLQRLDDEDSHLRRVACLALGKIGAVQAVKGLSQRLRDKDRKVRQAACQALAELGDPQAAVPLIERLADDETDVIRAAYAALERLGEGRIAKAVHGALRGKLEDCLELGRFAAEGDLRAVGPLVQRLKNVSVGDREAACAALGHLRDPQGVQPLIDSLDDWDSGVRRMTAIALGQLGEAKAVVPLIERLTDSAANVRSAVCMALGHLRDARAIEPLINCLADSEWPVCNAAAVALSELGGDQSVEPLILRLKASERNIRKAACMALGNLRNPQAISPLIERLMDRENEVRESACAALEKLGEARLGNALAGAVKGNRDARTELANMIGEGDLRPVETLVLWLRQPSGETRGPIHAALDAIWRVLRLRVSLLLCPTHLVRFKEMKASSMGFGNVPYAACPVCGHSWPAIEAARVVLVLDSISLAKYVKEGEVLRVNWLVRGELFDFDAVEIAHANDEQVKRFLGLIRSDHELQTRCKRLRCDQGQDCPLEDNTVRNLKNVFGVFERVVGGSKSQM